MTPEKALIVFTDCKRAYQLAFNTPPGEAVLADLAPFCRAAKPASCPATATAPMCWKAAAKCTCVSAISRSHPEQLVERYTRPAKGAISHDDPSDPPA
jgi:hypothetical protein